MASEDIQTLLDTQPPALPPKVARVKADGTPTTHLLDWELFQTEWFKSNIIATDTRIDTVKATADDAAAKVEVETSARVSADEALAQQITTVSASVGNATAQGQIYFAAAAVPGGAVSAYGLYLTAGNAFTGFEALAMSDGTSAIGLTASQFLFTDSGTAKPVLSYSSGKWSFTSDVEVNGDLVVNGSIVTDKIAVNAVSNFGSASTSDDTSAMDVYVTANKSGDRIILFLSINPTDNFLEGDHPLARNLSAELTTNGNIQTEILYAALVGVTNAGVGSEVDLVKTYRYSAGTYQYTWTAPSAGSHRIRVNAIPTLLLKGFALCFSR
jgi:hypothetical protein